ncbi:uncharacterized protein LOC135390960 [Ornithodoros turicata]|uniref:Uncharacterized protein n=1 Tax=Ornithodoros turicata TaxID=34597 RepID=A0A2R5LM66_9ACAR
MPRKNLPPSLYHICLHAVTAHMDDIFSENENAFQGLPAAINEDILHILQSLKPAASAFYYICCILRTAQLRKVNVSLIDSDAAKHSRLPQILLNMKQHLLQELSLGGAHLEDDVQLVTVISGFYKLRVLRLLLPNITDCLVTAIASYCLCLEELVLYGERVTDGSVQLLVRCSKLKVLKLESDRSFRPQTSPLTSFKLLSELKNLRRAKLPYLSEALHCFSVGTKLLLTEYQNTDDAIPTEDGLLHVCQVCPHLNKVNLVLRGHEDLSPLQWLRSLGTLSLKVLDSHSGAFFRVQIQPLLCVIGSNLTSLSLCLSVLDLGVISRFCSGLKELEIVNLRRIFWGSYTQAIFPALKSFKFFLDVDNTVTSDDLSQLLRGSRNLRELSLGWCRLTDDALKALVDCGALLRLRVFEMSEVEDITSAGLRRLVEVESDLTMLTVFGCDRVSRRDISALRDYVNEKNYALTIKHHM